MAVPATWAAFETNSFFSDVLSQAAAGVLTVALIAALGLIARKLVQCWRRMQMWRINRRASREDDRAVATRSSPSSRADPARR